MAGKREKLEDIVLKLRQVEGLQEPEKSVSAAVRQIGGTIQTYSRWRKGRVMSAIHCPPLAHAVHVLPGSGQVPDGECMHSPDRQRIAGKRREGRTGEALMIRGERRLNSADVVNALTDLFIMRGPPEFIRSPSRACKHALTG